MPGKRPYRLGKRKASVEETKRRIIDAATAEYQENGIEDTSMNGVARRAEVAPGTVLYHYPTADDLAQAVVDSWIEDFVPPSVESIDSQDPIEDRIGALVRELFDLYERTGWAYRVYQKSPHHPVLQRASRWWEENVGAMMMKALGDRGEEPENLRVVSVLVNPGFRGTLIGTGISADRAAEVSTELVLGWLS
jgi:AcrR family transcriptional regulator